MVRTSQTDPIRVDWLPADLQLGRVGLTFAPGKKASARYMSGPWDRDLGTDLDELVKQGVDVLVSLLEADELRRIGIPDFVGEAEKRHLTVLSLPIRDGGVLPELEPVRALVERIRSLVAAGRRVVVFCRGGLGRTGTIAGCYLATCGISPKEAFPLLRKVRNSDNIPENEGQRLFIQRFANSLSTSALDEPGNPPAGGVVP